MKFNILVFGLLALVAGFTSACSAKKIDDSNPQELFKDAEEDVNDKRYTIALDKLKSLKNKFPYSNLATEAQLRIADVYYLEDSFIEAAASYEAFRDMHPKHAKADFVLFRIGESYYNQLPGGEDRDLSPGSKAIEAYRELAAVYPTSQYVAPAKEHSNKTTEILAAKEKYIADFYFVRDMFDSAANRYEKLTSRYSGSSLDEYAFWRWGKSLVHQGKNDEAKHAYNLYLSRYPQGLYAKAAGDWLQNNETTKETK